MHRPLQRRLALAIVLMGVLAGCGPNIECMDFPLDSGDCERIAEAALPEVPQGAGTITVVQGVTSGSRTPYPVVACYPDGTAVAVEVTVTADETRVGPYRGEALPFECDR